MGFPAQILGKAIRAVPAVKYALGIAGVVAAIAIVESMHISYSLAALGTVVMLVLMTTLVVFARIAKTTNAQMHTPALVFTSFALLLTMATAFLLFTSVFFGTPVDLQRVFTPLEPNAGGGIVPPTVAAEPLHPEPFGSIAIGLKVQNLPPPTGRSDAEIVEMSLSAIGPGRQEARETATDLTTPIGVRVLRVMKKSPAFRAGLRPNDLVSAILPNSAWDKKQRAELTIPPDFTLNREPLLGLGILPVYVWNKKQWVEVTDALNQTSTVNLKIWREGKPIDVLLTVGNRRQTYQNGCESKDEDACYGLGLLYEDGETLEKDLQRAKFYFKLACDSKSGIARTELGVLDKDPALHQKGCLLKDGAGCRRYGISVKTTDPKRAAENLSASCDYGDPFGCLQLASVAGAERTTSTAHDLYRRACWWGEEDGCKNVDSITYEQVKDKERQKYERIQDQREGIERSRPRDSRPEDPHPEHAEIP